MHHCLLNGLSCALFGGAGVFLADHDERSALDFCVIGTIIALLDEIRHARGGER